MYYPKDRAISIGPLTRLKLVMLSYTEENYIKAIYKLSEKSEEGITTNAIAEILDIRAGSVTDMLKKLSEKELIHYTKYTGVGLIWLPFSTTASATSGLGRFESGFGWQYPLISVLHRINTLLSVSRTALVISDYTLQGECPSWVNNTYGLSLY